MKALQMLSGCMQDWARISGNDFTLINEKNEILLSTADRALPSKKVLSDFRAMDCVCQGRSGHSLFKADLPSGESDLLIVYGSPEEASKIGALALCQIQSLFEACQEKTSKSAFLADALAGNLSEKELLSQARKLKISPDAPRCVFLIETRPGRTDSALATLKSIAPARDLFTTLDESCIVLIHEAAQASSAQLYDWAAVLVDMLNTEAMTPARIAFSKVTGGLTRLPSACRQARTAMEIGKIFYAEKHIFSYERLGIGRLIYQLPPEICELYISEFFEKGVLESLDEESLVTIRTFFENNLNLSETSRQLYVHRNTLMYRFEKLEKKLGLDVRSFEDALTFKLCMMVSDYLGYRKKEGSQKEQRL